MKTFNISYQTYSEIWFSNTLGTFQILYIFYVKVLGKLNCKETNFPDVVIFGLRKEKYWEMSA